MAREGLGYPCYQRDMMMMISTIKSYFMPKPSLKKNSSIRVGISTIKGYLMSKPSLKKNSSISVGISNIKVYLMLKPSL